MQGFLLQVEVSKIIVHEADEPNALVDFLDAEPLAGQHDGDVAFLAVQAEASAIGNENVAVVEGIGRDKAAVDVRQVLADGYGYVLSLDSQRLRIERRITELAANAEDPAAASELRRLWLEHRTLGAEVSTLRRLLRRLRDAQPAAR